MANESIRQLADVLGMATARLSGDPQRMQMALGMQQSRRSVSYTHLRAHET